MITFPLSSFNEYFIDKIKNEIVENGNPELTKKTNRRAK